MKSITIQISDLKAQLAERVGTDNDGGPKFLNFVAYRRVKVYIPDFTSLTM